MEKRKRALSSKQLAEVNALNKKLAKKKSNIKSRHGIQVDIPKIDVNLKGKALKSQIEAVQSFLNPHNTKYRYVKNSRGVSIPLNEVNEFKRLTKRVNKIRAKEFEKIKQIEFTTANVKGPLAKISPSRLQSFPESRQITSKIDGYRDLTEFRTKLKMRKKAYEGNFLERSRQRYQDNYIEGLLSELGGIRGTKELAEKLASIPRDEFYFKSFSRTELEIKYIYDLNQQQEIFTKLEHYWSSVIEDIE